MWLSWLSMSRLPPYFYFPFHQLPYEYLTYELSRYLGGCVLYLYPYEYHINSIIVISIVSSLSCRHVEWINVALLHVA